MNKKLWFRAKQYGWGWYPVTWEGWAAPGFYIVLVILNFTRPDPLSPFIEEDILCAVSVAVGLTLILIAICYKTGETPRWRWGGKGD